VNGEKDNICNLPELMSIEVHMSKETGRYYLHFIEWTDTTCNNNGSWTDMEISGKIYNALRKICYPMWDGTHRKFRYGNGDCFRVCKKPCRNSVLQRINEAWKRFEEKRK